MAEVLLEGVTKKFDGVDAVHPMSLTIHDQEFFVLLGPSGCGKTTTLRMVAGLEGATTGRIHVGGQDVTDVPPKDRNMAMVFQNYALYPHMTVFDNMAFGLKLRQLKKDEIRTRVQTAADVLGITPYLLRRPKELSGGQRQRVALGRAIVRDPAVFLMDEPLSNLDAKLRTQTRIELKRLHERLKTTTLYVTHDQTEAMTLGTRIMVMNEGRIQQIGTPQEIYHSPANEFVATFVGTPPMNLLTGEIRRLHNQWVIQIGREFLPLSRRHSALVASLENSRVVVGVRPEDVRLAGANDGTVAGIIQLVEPMGHENVLHIEVQGQRILVRISHTMALRVGGQVRVAANKDLLNLFDPKTGDRLGA